MGIAGVSGASAASSAAQSAGGGRHLGQTEFLSLLVTQLTNQDPMSPQEDKEFVAQMAQFSALEAANQTSAALSRLQGAALLGRTVQAVADGDAGSMPVTGVVSAVAYRQDGVHLLVGESDVMLSDVSEVSVG
ncbi:MAG: flagellar hook capping protein [Chthonomonadales bacterium]|nr:flagellar hook capping protein [Chthonomonadales bacterium]